MVTKLGKCKFLVAGFFIILQSDCVEELFPLEVKESMSVHLLHMSPFPPAAGLAYNEKVN